MNRSRKVMLAVLTACMVFITAPRWRKILPTSLHESEAFARRVGGGPGQPHDAGGKDIAARQPRSVNPAAQCSCVRLVERGLTRRRCKWHQNFPSIIGLAATFDVPRIHEMASALGIEGHIQHAQDERAGHSDIFEGLGFWAPNLNILAIRAGVVGKETYGEDPFLSAPMAITFVTGMHGDDPHYYRVISTPKLFAVHSGPEPTRHFAGVDISKHDEEDTYLPLSRAAVVEGHAGSVMYKSINGEPACASKFLLQPRCVAPGISKATWSPTAAQSATSLVVTLTARPSRKRPPDFVQRGNIRLDGG